MKLTINKDEKLNILHFADLHFGIETRNYHNGKVAKTLEFMKQTIKESNPNLIIAGGDCILCTGENGLKEFIKLMDSFETPWAFVFGNHDVESRALNGPGSKKEASNILIEHSKNSNYLLYEDKYFSNKEIKYGNYSIQVFNHDETLRGSIIIMDSGIHNGEIYEGISKEQVKWYEEEIDYINKTYGKSHSLLFTHIQLTEFYDAYINALKDESLFVVKQILTDEETISIKNDGPFENTYLFNSIVKKGSTKAVFVGHAHNFNFQVKKENIILGFAPQTGHSNIFPKDDDPRQTYNYQVDTNFDFNTQIINEILEN